MGSWPVFLPKEVHAKNPGLPLPISWGFQHIPESERMFLKLAGKHLV